MLHNKIYKNQEWYDFSLSHTHTEQKKKKQGTQSKYLQKMEERKQAYLTTGELGEITG